MTKLTTPAQSSGGSCCGGAAAQPKPQVTPADKSAPAPVGNTKLKSVTESGCCG